MRVVINNQEYSFKNEMTILEACHEIGIKIPTLCYLKDVNNEASCRMCVVEIKGRDNLVPACNTKIYDGLEIFTNSKKVINSRKKTLELLIENHNRSCLTCDKSGYCKLQELADTYNIKLLDTENNDFEVLIDDSNHAIIRDNSKCILCNRCVNFCAKIQGVEAIKRINRGDKTYIGSAYNKELKDTKCIYCGGCVNVCPTGALMEKSAIDKVYEALDNKDLEVVISYAPAVRVTIGEAFGYKIGENVSKKLNTVLRMMGFNTVLDVSFGADMTVIEEATELIERLKASEYLPLMTSCCPAWVNYIKNFYPEYLSNLSTVKSPLGITGSLCKTYYANEKKINPKKIFMVTVMPCIAKKDEILNRDNATNYNDVDAVLTTRELIKMIKIAGINLKDVSGSDFDNIIGKGNSVIFGTSGGVMETALRYAKEKLEGKGSKNLEYKEVRGSRGVKEATYLINNKKIKVLVASGISNIKPYLQSGKINDYHFVEVMACPSGCINGAGSPYLSDDIRNFTDYVKLRSSGLYGTENTYKSKKAKDNVLVKEVYKNYLEEPGSIIAHKILHTKHKPNKEKKY